MAQNKGSNTKTFFLFLMPFILDQYNIPIIHKQFLNTLLGFYMPIIFFNPNNPNPLIKTKGNTGRYNTQN